MRQCLLWIYCPGGHTIQRIHTQHVRYFTEQSNDRVGCHGYASRWQCCTLRIDWQGSSEILILYFTMLWENQGYIFIYSALKWINKEKCKVLAPSWPASTASDWKMCVNLLIRLILPVIRLILDVSRPRSMVQLLPPWKTLSIRFLKEILYNMQLTWGDEDTWRCIRWKWAVGDLWRGPPQDSSRMWALVGNVIKDLSTMTKSSRCMGC